MSYSQPKELLTTTNQITHQLVKIMAATIKKSKIICKNNSIEEKHFIVVQLINFQLQIKKKLGSISKIGNKLVDQKMQG